jgi:hypothetical protein
MGRAGTVPYVCMYVCMYGWMDVCIHVYMYTCMDVSMYRCMHVCHAEYNIIFRLIHNDPLKVTSEPTSLASSLYSRTVWLR